MTRKPVKSLLVPIQSHKCTTQDLTSQVILYWISDIFVLLKWSKKVGYRMSDNFNSNGYPEEMAEDIDLQRAER
ncbi:TPA: hypothetical protein ACQ8KT_004962, partial [Escherichia coli]